MVDAEAQCMDGQGRCDGASITRLLFEVRIKGHSQVLQLPSLLHRENHPTSNGAATVLRGASHVRAKSLRARYYTRVSSFSGLTSMDWTMSDKLTRDV